jgi:hypothetical protein
MMLDNHHSTVEHSTDEMKVSEEPKSEAEFRDEQAGRPSTAQQNGEERIASQKAESSTFKNIVNEWLQLQKRMIDVLTPMPLDAIELGGNFDAPKRMEDWENPETSDISHLLGLYPTAICENEPGDLDKNIRYNAVWRIISSGGESKSLPDLVLPVNLHQLGI